MVLEHPVNVDEHYVVQRYHPVNSSEFFLEEQGQQVPESGDEPGGEERGLLVSSFWFSVAEKCRP